MNLSRVPLSDIADFVNGVAFKPDDWEESGKRILRIQNLTDSTKPFNRTNRVVAKRYEVSPGDLLVSWSATLGVFVWEGPDTALVNQHIFRVVPDHGRIDPRYLKHMLSDALVQMEQHLHGATMKHVNRGEFLATTIPLPPLDEQRRIAGILDAADALRAKRREALAQLDTLLQSTFLDMFGDPVTNPMGWEAPALSEVTDEIYRYPTYFGIVYENEGVPEIRGELIGKGGKLDADPSELRFIAQVTSDKFPRTQLAAGDLVMSVRGTIGKIGIVPAELANANITANLIRISPARSIIDPVFLLHVTLGPYFLNQLSRASSSTTIKTIKALDLKVIPIPLPPLDLQRRFAAIVESVEHQKARQRAHLAELDTLFASLQSHAFRGDL